MALLSEPSLFSTSSVEIIVSALPSHRALVYGQARSRWPKSSLSPLLLMPSTSASYFCHTAECSGCKFLFFFWAGGFSTIVGRNRSVVCSNHQCTSSFACLAKLSGGQASRCTSVLEGTPKQRAANARSSLHRMRSSLWASTVLPVRAAWFEHQNWQGRGEKELGVDD